MAVLGEWISFFRRNESRLRLDSKSISRYRSAWLNNEDIEFFNPPPSLKLYHCALRDDSSNTMKMLQAAVHGWFVCFNGEHSILEFVGEELPKIIVHLYNVKPLNEINQVRSHMVDRIVSVSGTVIRSTRRRTMATCFVYSCDNCSELVYQKCVDGRAAVLRRCCQPGCSGVLTMEIDKAMTTEASVIRLQADSEDAKDHSYANIDVQYISHCEQDWIPGDSIAVVGLTCQTPVTQNFKNEEHQALYSLYIEGWSIVPTKCDIDVWVLEQCKRGGELTSHLSAAEAASNAPSSKEGPEKRLLQILNDSGTTNLFSSMVSSFCPDIDGWLKVKSGLLLSLLGGEAQPHGNRGSIHTLLIGDPGLGKTTLLEYARSLSSKGIYVCGSLASSSGLTASVVRDPDSGEYTVEGGAMVAADRGVCCIDEIDKLVNANYESFLEGMESQRITIAKAGLINQISAKATIIAAGNPSGGCYNHDKSLTENTRIPAELISRFDLVFVLDQSSHARDRDSGLDRDGALTPASRLSIGELSSIISHCQGISPDFSPPALEAIRSYYVARRKQWFESDGESPKPNKGLLHSLVRLSQARARGDAQSVVSEEHVNFATALISDKYVSPGSSRKLSQKKRPRVTMDSLERAIKECAANADNSVDDEAIKTAVASCLEDPSGEQVEKYVQRLNFRGSIIRRPNNKWSVYI